MRRARTVDQSFHPVDVVPREPLVELLAAHPEAFSEFGDRVQTGEIRLDEAGSFFHWTGYLPWHHTPSLPEDECHPCSRSVLSPMCPVCTILKARSLLLPWSFRTPNAGKERLP